MYQGGERLLQSINAKKELSISKSNNVEVICYCCGKKIKRSPSELRNSKHGFYFCDRKCKEKSQSLKGNCPEIRPSHYGTSEGREFYRNFIKNSQDPICIGCGETTRYLLQIHHIDGDHSNNQESNFEIVCANCHIKRHLKMIDEKWIFSTQSLTHRKLIK
jgi:hypothetical protein